MSVPIFSQEALCDIEEIAEFVGQARPHAALKLVERIIQVCETLAINPLMGTACHHFLADARCMSVSRYAIYFRPVKDTVRVLRVIDGARDQPSALSDKPQNP